jgi:hypothetical protein
MCENAESSRVLYEVRSIAEASPSLLTHCSLLTFTQHSLAWRDVFTSWLQSAKQQYVLTNQRFLIQHVLLLLLL